MVGSKSSKLCFDCPHNSASLPGSPICCPIGQYLKQGVSPSCEDCQVNYYADSRGANSCKKCPDGTNRSLLETKCTGSGIPEWAKLLIPFGMMFALVLCLEACNVFLKRALRRRREAAAYAPVHTIPPPLPWTGRSPPC